MKTEFTVDQETIAVWSGLLNVALFGGSLSIYWFLAGPFLLDEVAQSWLYLLIGIPVAFVTHEWIHVLSFRLFGGAPKDTVSVWFHWRTLTPVAHCSVPLRAGAYRLSCLAPMLVLGLIPLAASIGMASPTLAVFGAVMVAAGGADLIVVVLIHKVGRNQLVKDHESRVGCTVVTDA